MKDDLGFTFEKLGNDVHIYHRGVKACSLRGDKASMFFADISSSDIKKQQHIMARLTGNYKRGNERGAKRHPRNRS